MGILYIPLILYTDYLKIGNEARIKFSRYLRVNVILVRKLSQNKSVYLQNKESKHCEIPRKDYLIAFT